MFCLERVEVGVPRGSVLGTNTQEKLKNDMYRILQKCDDWFNGNNLLNTAKTQRINFTFKGISTIRVDYNNNVLVSVTNSKFLRVVIDHQLN